jgi:hypothetical protein
MYELLSLTVGLSFYALVGWLLYRTYRAVANRVPALDRAVNARASALRSAVTSERGATTLGVTYLWALTNHHARYRRPTNPAPAVSEEPRYLDAA